MTAMRHVVITGVSRGLGRAMALRFAADGWSVSGCGTDAEALESVSRELGPDHHVQVCEVTDPPSVDAFAHAVTGRFGPPDLLLNNAATIHPNKPLWEATPEEFARVVDVNLKGVHLVIRAFVPGMIRRGSGVVVNFSSGWGRSTSPDVAAYCATKWGIEGLTSALAQELPRGLAAVALNPGETVTLGNRTLTAVKPPIFDNPCTTGFYDGQAGVLLSSDCFGALLQAVPQNAADLSDSDLRDGQITWATIDSPWIHKVDTPRVAGELDAIRRINPKLILSNHLPPAPGHMLERFLGSLAAAPGAYPFVGPNQAALDQMLKQMAAPQ